MASYKTLKRRRQRQRARERAEYRVKLSPEERAVAERMEAIFVATYEQAIKELFLQYSLFHLFKS